MLAVVAAAALLSQFGAQGLKLFTEDGPSLPGDRDAPEPPPSEFIDLLSKSSQPIQPMSWADANLLASQVVADLSMDELLNLAHGSHFSFQKMAPETGFYTGNTEAVPRLGIPALKMQDAGQGFRPTDPAQNGTTTSFPCLLALASTWDETLTGLVASSIAEEFASKGANVMLGPSVNVHRVATNGRNFEYLSGEDPYLGSRLTFKFVEAVQAAGVMATVKHFAFNEQETNRQVQNSVVDERTAWELYYPPFEAAVGAGVGAIMCSYNRVNGSFACESEELLKHVLRDRMKFKGLVMSDWYATHAHSALLRGLDQEMPGTDGSQVGNVISHINLAKIQKLKDPVDALRKAAVNVLTAIYRLRLHERPGCVPPACDAQLHTNAKSERHSLIARAAASHAVVLLKNDGHLLPFHRWRVHSIAISGPAAEPNAAGGLTADYYSGGGSGHVPVGAVQSPRQAIVARAAKAGIKVVNGTAADVCIVVVGATASEGVDRTSLNVEGEPDIEKAAHECNRTVVLMQTPGAVVTPWRERVDSIANLFLGGEETANAWAAMLFGDHTPSGKLPVTFPESMIDVVRPGLGWNVNYSEGLLTAYRSPTVRAAFPFGHGLSYANFEYTDAKAKPKCPWSACAIVTITNPKSSRYPGREVVQAYVHFGNQPREPNLMLRGFHKTGVLKPGQTEKVFFRLDPRDLSVYKPEIGGWVEQRNVTLHIGSSSADIRAVVPLIPKF